MGGLFYAYSALVAPSRTQQLHRKTLTDFFFFFFGLHRYECLAPLVANSLQSGRFWARSTASVHDSPWESRSFCTVFIQVIRGRPGGLFHYTDGEEVKICFVYIVVHSGDMPE